MFKHLYEFRSNIVEKSEYLFYFYFIFRYYPLIVLTHEWYLFENYGMFSVLDKISIYYFLEAIDSPVINKMIFYTFSLITVYILSFFLYVLKTKNNKEIARLLDQSRIFIGYLFWFYFYFPHFLIEIITMNFLKRICHDDNPGYLQNSTNSECYSISLVDGVFSVLHLITSFLINYFFEIFMVSPHQVNMNDFHGSIFTLDFNKIILPYFHVFFFIDKLFFLNKAVLIIKIIIRVSYIIHFFVRLKNLTKTKSLLELFILCFCFTSCIVEMCYLNVFLSIENLEQFKNNPSEYTVYYSIRFIVLKLVFQFCVCYYLVSYLKKTELENVSNFHGGIKSNYMFSFFNRLIHYIYNYESLSNNTKSSFLINFYNSLANHRSRCRTPKCDCEVIELKFKKINLMQDEKTKTTAIKNFFINIISDNVKKFDRNQRPNNESINHFELLFIDILVCLFLTKHYITGFFNIEKLISYKSIKNSTTSRIRLKLLELDIIAKFINENKKSINQTFIQLYENFCEFDSLNKLLEKNEICFRNYKIITEKIAKVNNYSNNFFNINSKKTLSIYNYQEFADDLKKLKISVDSCQILAEKVLKNRDKYDNILIKNLMIYFKFFQGNCNDSFRKKSNSIRKYQSFNNTNNTNNNLEKEDLLDNKSSQRGKSQINNDANTQGGENQNFRKEDDFLNEIIDKISDTEKIILKQTKEGNLIFEKITAHFAETLSYKTKEIIGQDLNFLLPEMLIELHHSHVVHFLIKNNTLVKNKEIYFVSKNGYCVNYYISGTIVLTLDEEVIIYVEIAKVIKEEENTHDVAFLSCDLAGEIIAYDEGIYNHLFIDTSVIMILKPNFFKTFLDISNQNFDFEKKNMKFEFDYHNIIRNLRNIDFSKLIDYKNKDRDANFNYLSVLDNSLNFVNNGKITIEFTKRNLLKKFYFYDCRLDFSKIRRFDIKLNIPKEYYVYYKRKNTKYKHTMLNSYLVEKERNLFSNFIEIVKGVSIFFKTDLNNLEENMKIIKIFTDNYLEQEDPEISLEVYQNFKVFKENNKFEYDESELDIWINFKSRLFSFFIFILIFIVSYIFMDNFNRQNIEESKMFLDFSYSSISIKSQYISVAGSFLSIFLIKNEMEPERIEFPIALGNQNNLYSFNNSIEYHSDLITKRSTDFLNDFYNLKLIYTKYNSLVLKNNNVMKSVLELKVLTRDWQTSTENHTLLNDLNLFHLKTHKFSIKEIKASNLTLFNDNAYNFTIVPSDSDNTIFRSIENTIDPIIPIFNKLIDSNYENFIEFSNQNKQILLIIYALCSVISIIFITVEFYFFIINFENIFMRYYIVFNYLRVFNSSVCKKINIILEIFNDFTEEGLNEMKKNNKLLKTQFSIDKGNPFFEKLKQQNDIKIRRMKTNKNGLHSSLSIKLFSACDEINQVFSKNSRQPTLRNQVSFANKDSFDQNISNFNINKIEDGIFSGGNKHIFKSLLPKPHKQVNSKISKGFFSVLQLYKLKNIVKNKKYKKEKEAIEEEMRRNNNMNTKTSLIKKGSLKQKKIESIPKKKYLNCEIADTEASIANLGNINKLTKIDEEKEEEIFTNTKRGKSKISSSSGLNINNISNIPKDKELQSDFHDITDDQDEKTKPMVDSLPKNKMTNKTGNFGSETGSFLNFTHIINKENEKNLNQSGNENPKKEPNVIFDNNEDVNKSKTKEPGFYKNLELNRPSASGNILTGNNLEVINENSSPKSKEKIKSYKSLKKRGNGSLIYKILDNPTESNIKFINENVLSSAADVKKRKSILTPSTKRKKNPAFKKFNNLLSLASLRLTGFEKNDENVWKQNKIIIDNTFNEKNNFLIENSSNNIFNENYNDSHLNTNNNTNDAANYNNTINNTQNSTISAFNSTKNNLLKLNDNNNSNNNNLNLLDKIPRIEFRKPQTYYILKYLFIISILLILLTGSIIFTTITFLNDQILLNYNITKNFLVRNIAIFELFYFFKISILKGKILESYDTNTSSNYRSFERSLKNFEAYTKTIKDYMNNGDLKEISLDSIQNIEKNLNTYNFCSYFAYYKDEKNLNSILTDISNMNLINVNLESLKNNTIYNKEVENCVNRSGGLLNSGFSDFLNTAKYFINNYNNDLERYLQNESLNGVIDKNALRMKIKELVNEVSLLKIYLNINDKIYDINNIYTNLFRESNDKLYSKLVYRKDLANYSMFAVICLITICYLLFIKFLIDEPLNLIKESEFLINNSILFNTLDI